MRDRASSYATSEDRSSVAIRLIAGNGRCLVPNAAAAKEASTDSETATWASQPTIMPRTTRLFDFELEPRDLAEVNALLVKGRDVFTTIKDCGGQYRR